MRVMNLIMGTMKLIDMVMTIEMVMVLQVVIERVFFVLLRVLAVIMHVYIFFQLSVISCYCTSYCFNHSHIAMSTVDAVYILTSMSM